MTQESHPSAFEYDVALSFASANKSTAEKLGDLCTANDITVFLDEYTGAEPWGENVVDHLVNLSARKARCCVLLISQHYPLKRWTEAEQTSVQERALRDPNEYIILLRLDDVDVPGLTTAISYTDIDEHSVEHVVGLLKDKLTQLRSQSGPPPKSHDLRSGNVPTQGSD